MVRLNKIMAGALVATALTTQFAPPSDAYVRYYHRPVTRVYVSQYRAPWGYRHPIIKRTLIGAGIGTGVGLLGGALMGHHRAGRGALIGGSVGALIGAGSGWLRYH